MTHSAENDAEFSAYCKFCGPSPAVYPSGLEAQRGAVWHVYDDHPEEWRRVVGDRPPRDPRPMP